MQQKIIKTCAFLTFYFFSEDLAETDNKERMRTTSEMWNFIVHDFSALNYANHVIVA